LKLKAETGVETTPWQDVIIFAAKIMRCRAAERREAREDRDDAMTREKASRFILGQNDI
jgi:hypothetical protein